MSSRDRQRWDAIYRAGERVALPAPDPLLFQYTPPPVGERHALDLAAGLGQNGLWLASQGYVVDIVDVSRVALMRSQAEAAARGLRSLNFFQLDLDDADLETDAYDVVCVFRYLKRELFASLRASIRPGGRIIYETFNTRYLGVVPDFNPAFLLQPGELAGSFSEWKLLHHAEAGYVTQLVALKPD